MLFRHISGQGGTGEDRKINKNIKQAKKTNAKMDNWKKRVFFKGGVFLSKNGGLNGSRITDVLLKTNDNNVIKHGTTKNKKKREIIKFS